MTIEKLKIDGVEFPAVATKSRGFRLIADIITPEGRRVRIWERKGKKERETK